MRIKVTIGICAKNCESAVRNIVTRISNQDYPHENMEVIFVEEGSIDGTLSSILKYASGMDIQYKVYHQEWKGLGYSRNVVVKNALGDYIVWVDDGTLIPKDYVRRHVEFMDKHQNAGISKGIIGVYYGTNRVATLENMIALGHSKASNENAIKKLPGTGGSVFRAKAARQVGGFNESIQGATEDTDIAYRILLAGWQIYKTQVRFSIVYPDKLKKIWDKNFWYGYGTHFTLHKHKELGEILYRGTPAAGFLEGILIFSTAYKLTYKKIAFLLPFFLFLKRTAFCLGFIKSHNDSYGH